MGRDNGFLTNSFGWSQFPAGAAFLTSLLLSGLFEEQVALAPQRDLSVSALIGSVVI